MWFLNLINEMDSFSMKSCWGDPVLMSFANKFFSYNPQSSSAWNAARKALDSLKEDGLIDGVVISRKTKNGGGTLTLWTKPKPSGV